MSSFKTFLYISQILVFYSIWIHGHYHVPRNTEPDQSGCFTKRIEDYSEAVLGSCIQMRIITKYKRTNIGGLTEIRHRIVLNPWHYTYLWIGGPFAIGQALSDAYKKDYTHYFEESTGKYLGNVKKEAEEKLKEIQMERKKELDHKLQEAKIQMERKKELEHKLQEAKIQMERRKELEHKLQEAIQLINENSYNEALNEYNSVLKIDPNNNEALYGVGIVKLLIAAYEFKTKGDELLEKALDLNNKQDYINAKELYNQAINKYIEAKTKFETVGKEKFKLVSNIISLRIEEIKKTISEINTALRLESGVVIDTTRQEENTDKTELNEIENEERNKEIILINMALRLMSGVGRQENKTNSNEEIEELKTHRSLGYQTKAQIFTLAFFNWICCIWNSNY